MAQRACRCILILRSLLLVLSILFDGTVHDIRILAPPDKKTHEDTSARSASGKRAGRLAHEGNNYRIHDKTNSATRSSSGHQRSRMTLRIAAIAYRSAYISFVLRSLKRVCMCMCMCVSVEIIEFSRKPFRSIHPFARLVKEDRADFQSISRVWLISYLQSIFIRPHCIGFS